MPAIRGRGSVAEAVEVRRLCRFRRRISFSHVRPWVPICAQKYLQGVVGALPSPGFQIPNFDSRFAIRSVRPDLSRWSKLNALLPLTNALTRIVLTFIAQST